MVFTKTVDIYATGVTFFDFQGFQVPDTSDGAARFEQEVRAHPSYGRNPFFRVMAECVSVDPTSRPLCIDRILEAGFDHPGVVDVESLGHALVDGGVVRTETTSGAIVVPPVIGFQDSGSLLLWHGTTAEKASKIQKDGFMSPSEGGVFGPGVYLTSAMPKPEYGQSINRHRIMACLEVTISSMRFPQLSCG